MGIPYKSSIEIDIFKGFVKNPNSQIENTQLQNF